MGKVKHIVITGASSGLGLAIHQAIEDNRDFGEVYVHDWSLATDVDVRYRSSVELAAMKLGADKIYAVINCAGVNNIEWFDKVTDQDFMSLMSINAKAIMVTTQTLLDRLGGGTVLNIVSNASHMPMTNSLAYNASKGAAHIMTLQMARELRKTHNITVFGVSPNKLKGTGMSKYIDERVPGLRGWTPEEAKAYQLASLPAGEETDPAMLGEFIAFLLSTKERHMYLNGCIIPYGA